MAIQTSAPTPPSPLGRRLIAWLADWRRVFFFGALAAVMILSKSTYDQANRASIARQIHVTTWQILPWFSVLSGVISLVLIRVVLVTAVGYGLSRFALDMVVRVLVLEVIPLIAALYVTMRSILAVNPQVAGLHIPRNLDVLGGADTDRVRDELVPRVIAYAFSVLAMVVVSGVVTLFMAYVSVYGFSRWGLPEFDRTVSQAFDPLVTAGFMLKVMFFSLAVAVIPIAASLDAPPEDSDQTAAIPAGTVRLFVALFVIEGLSLVVRYV